jgi:hypothetical protein
MLRPVERSITVSVVDVGGDDGAAAGDLVADELGRDVVGDLGAEGLAVALDRLLHLLAAHVLADGDELHLRGDDAGAGVLELGHGGAAFGPQRAALGGEFADQLVAGDVAVVLGLDLAAGVFLDVAAAADPGLAQARQAGVDVDDGVGVGVGAGGVVDHHRRLLGGLMQRNLAHRDADVGVALAGDENLAGRRQRPGGDGYLRRLGNDVHGGSPAL